MKTKSINLYFKDLKDFILLWSTQTLSVLLLLFFGKLQPYHLYILNAVNGLFNTVQQPASEVACTILIPKNQSRKQAPCSHFPAPLSPY